MLVKYDNRPTMASSNPSATSKMAKTLEPPRGNPGGFFVTITKILIYTRDG